MVGEDEGEGLLLLFERNQNSRIIPEKSNNESPSVSVAEIIELERNNGKGEEEYTPGLDNDIG